MQKYEPQATDDTRYVITSVTLSDLGADLSSILNQIGQLDINVIYKSMAR